MKSKVLFAALLASASPVIAQHNTLDNTSTSGSDATANSGSQSGASSDNTNTVGQAQQANNAGIGNSESVSVSDSTAVSGSASQAESNGNQQGQGQGQDQGQAQEANNSQGQALDNRNTNQLGATNQQGVNVSTTFNTRNRKVNEVRTNAAVPLAASSSFSSDYCGGTASGGASVAPLGVSIGGAAPTFDNSCRYLRVAEKAGMLGANYYNMRQPDMAGRAMSMMAWAVCMAGPQQDKRNKGNNENVTMQACLALGLLGSDMSPSSPQAQYQEPVAPMDTQKPNVQPLPDQYKTPRGELEFHSNPVIQDMTFNDTTKAAQAPRP